MPQDFETLYLSWQKQMILVAEQILRNRQDAEDAVHNALLRISRQQHTLPQEERSLRAYMLTSARHAAYDLLPKQRKEADIDTIVMADTDDLFQKIVASEDYQRLLKAIGQLPEKYRDVLMLRYVQELTVEEIAILLGKNRSTIHKQLSRAKGLLLRIYEKEET